MKFKTFVKKMKLINRIDKLHKARKYLLNEAESEADITKSLELLNLDNGVARRVEFLCKQYKEIV